MSKKNEVTQEQEQKEAEIRTEPEFRPIELVILPIDVSRLKSILEADGLTSVELKKRDVILTKISALYEGLAVKAEKSEKKKEEKAQALFIKQKFSGLSFEEKERLIALVLEEAESEEKDLVLEEAGSKNETEELSSIIEV